MPPRKKKRAPQTDELARELWERKKAIYRKLEELRVKIEEKENYLASL